MRVRAYVKGKYGPYSAYNIKHCLPGKVSGAKVKKPFCGLCGSPVEQKAGVGGYYIYRYDTKSKKNNQGSYDQR